MKDALGHGSSGSGEAHVHDIAAQHGIGTGHLSRPDGTYDAFHHDPTSGYMVGGAAHSRYTGEWTDPKTGQHYSEKSTRVNSEVLARSLGRQRNQISVYDLNRGRTISTGGTGKWRPH